MMSILWMLFIIIGIIYGILSNNLVGINTTIIDSTKISLDIFLKTFPVISLWMGLTKIAEESKLLEKLSNKLSKILKILFPEIPKSHKSFSLIASNIIANLFGLGSAATPFGLKAMSSLQELNEKKDTASRSMITFLVINTCGLTLIPTTIISLRIVYGSISPTCIIGACLLSTLMATIFGIILDRIFASRRRSKN